MKHGCGVGRETTTTPLTSGRHPSRRRAGASQGATPKSGARTQSGQRRLAARFCAVSRPSRRASPIPALSPSHFDGTEAAPRQAPRGADLKAETDSAISLCQVITYELARCTADDSAPAPPAHDLLTAAGCAARHGFFGGAPATGVGQPSAPEAIATETEHDAASEPQSPSPAARLRTEQIAAKVRQAKSEQQAGATVFHNEGLLTKQRQLATAARAAAAAIRRQAASKDEIARLTARLAREERAVALASAESNEAIALLCGVDARQRNAERRQATSRR